MTALGTTSGSTPTQHVGPIVRVAIVDDHAVVREGVERVVDSAADLTVDFAASSGSEFLERLAHAAVDVCVVDLSLPDMSGVELIESIRLSYPQLPIVVFTMHPEDALGAACLRAGADGFLTKGAAPSELQQAIREVAAGGRSVSPALTSLMARRGAGDEPAHTNLSVRETEVFLRMTEGLRNSEISRALGIDQRTVSTYRRRVLDKLGVTNEAELVRYAVRHGLVGTEVPTPEFSGRHETPPSLAFVGRDFVSQWETFMSGTEVALTAIDMTGTITHWSTYAEHLYGWSRAEAVGERIDRLIMGPAAITESAAEAMLSLQQRKAWEGLLTAQRRDGTVIDVYILHVGIVDSENQMIGVCAVSVLPDARGLDGLPSTDGWSLLETMPMLRRASRSGNAPVAARSGSVRP